MEEEMIRDKADARYLITYYDSVSEGFCIFIC